MPSEGTHDGARQIFAIDRVMTGKRLGWLLMIRVIMPVLVARRHILHQSGTAPAWWQPPFIPNDSGLRRRSHSLRAGNGQRIGSSSGQREADTGVTGHPPEENPGELLKHNPDRDEDTVCSFREASPRVHIRADRARLRRGAATRRFEGPQGSPEHPGRPTGEPGPHEAHRTCAPAWPVRCSV